MTAFFSACDLHRREVAAQVAWRADVAAGRPGNDPGIGSTEPARQALIGLVVVADRPLVAAATDFYARTVALGAVYAYVSSGAGPTPVNDVAWAREVDDLAQIAGAFERAARSELRGDELSE